MELARLRGHIQINELKGEIYDGRKDAAVPAGVSARDCGLVRSGRSPESLADDFEPSASVIRKRVRQADLDEGHRNDGGTEKVTVLF